MSQLGDLGELSFKMFKLGEVSLGILKLGELDILRFGMVKLVEKKWSSLGILMLV